GANASRTRTSFPAFTGPAAIGSGKKPIEAVVSGPLIAHDFPTMLGAAVEDMGLAQVTEPIAAGPVKAGKLVRVLEAFAP
ncbi:hypothetical protein ACC772_39690, partial [Rhizobium ruizarguesonis]